MNHSFVHSIQRPHLAFDFPVPAAQRVGRTIGKGIWIAALASLTAACAVTYLFLISRSASKAYEMRALERQRESLHEAVTSLENRTAEAQSLQALQEQVKGLGYVPVERLEYVENVQGSFALAR